LSETSFPYFDSGAVVKPRFHIQEWTMEELSAENVTIDDTFVFRSFGTEKLKSVQFI
jgi:hypothetical protein